MEFHKKILLLCVIMISFLILYRLSIKRIQLNKKELPKLESFIAKAPLSMKDSGVLTLPINQYFIKASWNTAYNGKNTMDLNMITFVLTRGCRFLDFEVYSMTDEKTKNKPVVGYSVSSNGNSYTSNYQTESNNTVDLADVFKVISKNAYYSVPNPSDPLIIQLRVKSNIPELYQNMVLDISNSLTKNALLVADTFNSDPMFTELLNKNYSNDTKSILKYMESRFFNKTVPDFKGLNMMANSLTLQLPIRTPVIDNSGVLVKYPNCLTCEKNTIQFTESFPDFSFLNIYNPMKSDLKRFILNYGINILPYRFYYNDDGLSEYENIFTNTSNCAFVKMSTLIQYFQIGKISKPLNK